MATCVYMLKDNRWRDQFNPLRGISQQRVNTLLESGERGQYADLQWFYYFMERTDPMVFAVTERRRSALLDSDWDIREVSGDVRGQPVDTVLSGNRRAGLRGGTRIARPCCPWCRSRSSSPW